MKRFLTAFLAMTCLIAVFCPAFAVVECKVPQVISESTQAPEVPVLLNSAADKKYASMGDLYQAWGGYEGYPDYICGVWSTDGGIVNMTVAMTDDAAGAQGREEILALLENPETVTFTHQRYSYKELTAVNDAIVERMIAGDTPIIACGIHEMENAVYVTLLESADHAQELAQELLKQYGDQVVVELGTAILTQTSSASDFSARQIVVIVVVAAAILSAVLVLVRSRFARAADRHRKS